MRLAENKNVIDKQRVASAIDEGKLSIRAAAKLIPPSATAKAAAATRAATKAANKALAAAKHNRGPTDRTLQLMKCTQL